ncbi:MAG: hypothetical protein ABJO36_01600 [Litorimonas sp.]
MKRLLLIAGACLLTPALSFAAEVPADEETSTAETAPQSSTLTSSGANQVAVMQSVYASESLVKLNTVYLSDADASGIYTDQTANINNAAIVNSNVNVNSIQLYGGEISSSVITQKTYVNGADVQASNLELNRVILN